VLHATYPGIQFRVANGPQASASVTWTDGPTEDMVVDLLGKQLSDDGQRPWRCACERTVSAELIVVSYLRAQDAGQPYFTYRQPGSSMLKSAKVLSDRLDAATISDAERLRAKVLLTIHPPQLVCGELSHLNIAEAVYQHWQVADTVLAPS